MASSACYSTVDGSMGILLYTHRADLLIINLFSKLIFLCFGQNNIHINFPSSRVSLLFEKQTHMDFSFDHIRERIHCHI